MSTDKIIREIVSLECDGEFRYGIVLTDIGRFATHRKVWLALYSIIDGAEGYTADDVAFACDILGKGYKSLTRYPRVINWSSQWRGSDPGHTTH